MPNGPSGPHNGGSSNFWSGSSVSPSRKNAAHIQPIAADNTRVGNPSGSTPPSDLERGHARMNNVRVQSSNLYPSSDEFAQQVAVNDALDAHKTTTDINSRDAAQAYGKRVANLK